MPGKSTNILLVEDNPGDARLVREMLAEFKNGDFEFHWVTSLSLAMDSLAAGGIDLVILDLDLPDGSGKELLPLLRSALPPIPVMVFSVYEIGPEDAKTVDAALVKSRTDNAQLLTTIKRLTGTE